MPARPEDSLYMEVAATTEEVSDTIVPDGETWEVDEFTGNAAYLDDTIVCLVWDPAGANSILGCTHGDAKSDLDGNIFITGYFTGDSDFDSTALLQSSTLPSAGEEDIFILKYNLEGRLLFKKRFGGVDYDIATCLVIDKYS